MTLSYILYMRSPIQIVNPDTVNLLMTGPAVAVQVVEVVPMTPQNPSARPQKRSLAKSMLVAPMPVCDPPLMI